ncbi:MAG: hypothetical protein EXR60_01740 [Dehalococcoidia bacterium]|nr:hypothetical protein [Dehalococcoidia bacterium]
MAAGLHGHTSLDEVVACTTCRPELFALLSEEFYADVRQADGAYIACSVCGQEQADRSVNYLAPGS